MEEKYLSETDPAGGEAGVTSGAQISTCADPFHPDPSIPLFPSSPHEPFLPDAFQRF